MGWISEMIQFASSVPCKKIILSKALPWECTCRKILKIHASIVFILSATFEQ